MEIITAPEPTRTETKTASAAHGAKPVAEKTAGQLIAEVAGNPRDKFHQLEKELNATFVEREKETRGIVLALLAREHVLLLGPAGTGKSALANVFCTAIDGARYFQWLLTRFSTPEELYGPVSLAGLKEDRFRRATAGKLPEANVAFLDEIFKANSAVLNSLLTALNERAFDNDGMRNSMPLLSCVGASNELPEGPELAALYDRFMLRFWTDYSKTPESFERLLTGAEPSVNVRISLAEITHAQTEVEKLPISKAAVEELFKLRAEISQVGIVASDRRWRKAMRVLRAVAWLDGASEVTTDVFPILASMLWDVPAQHSALVQAVSRYVSAELAEAQEIVDSISQLMAAVPADSKDPEFGPRGTAAAKEAKKANGKLEALAKAVASKPPIKAKIEAMTAELEGKAKSLRKAISKALGLD